MGVSQFTNPDDPENTCLICCKIGIESINENRPAEPQKQHICPRSLQVSSWKITEIISMVPDWICTNYIII